MPENTNRNDYINQQNFTNSNLNERINGVAQEDVDNYDTDEINEVSQILTDTLSRNTPNNNSSNYLNDTRNMLHNHRVFLNEKLATMTNVENNLTSAQDYYRSLNFKYDDMIKPLQDSVHIRCEKTRNCLNCVGDILNQCATNDIPIDYECYNHLKHVIESNESVANKYCETINSQLNNYANDVKKTLATNCESFFEYNNRLKNSQRSSKKRVKVKGECQKNCDNIQNDYNHFYSLLKYYNMDDKWSQLIIAGHRIANKQIMYASTCRLKPYSEYEPAFPQDGNQHNDRTIVNANNQNMGLSHLPASSSNPIRQNTPGHIYNGQQPAWQSYGNAPVGQNHTVRHRRSGS